MAVTLIDVLPIYGYGWVDFGASRVRENPAPFRVRLTLNSEGEWGGVVETAGHEFEGMMVRMSQRVRPWEGTVNVNVEGAATGWAAVNDYSLRRGSP